MLGHFVNLLFYQPFCQQVEESTLTWPYPKDDITKYQATNPSTNSNIPYLQYKGDPFSFYQTKIVPILA